MLSSDFFRGIDGFFQKSARLFTKKVLFRPKIHQRRFPRYRWNLGRFPRERWIFPRENLAVLVESRSFHSELKMEIPLGKEALSIACSEKVRGEGQHLRLFHRILPALPRKNPAFPLKKSGDSGDIF